jgi:hypothetical protein
LKTEFVRGSEIVALDFKTFQAAPVEYYALDEEEVRDVVLQDMLGERSLA